MRILSCNAQNLEISYTSCVCLNTCFGEYDNFLFCIAMNVYESIVLFPVNKNQHILRVVFLLKVKLDLNYFTFYKLNSNMV